MPLATQSLFQHARGPAPAQVLKQTGRPWRGLERLPGWPALLAEMRAAAADFLAAHGMTPEEAWRRCTVP